VESAILISELVRKDGEYYVFHYNGFFMGQKIREIYVDDCNNRVKDKESGGYILQLAKIRVVRGRIIARLIKATTI
jgi:hypothetical protein